MTHWITTARTVLAVALTMSLLPLSAHAGTIVFDDMEHGNPFGNGWFSFGGSVGAGSLVANSVDLPPTDGGTFSLEAGFGSGGTPGFFGGFGRTSITDLNGMDTFNFWINPDPGQEYVLEINLQEDDNGDLAFTPSEDDEFQFNCDIGTAGACAVAGGGWQLVSIAFSDFFDDNSFATGGNGVFDPFSPGELFNVVFAIVSTSGSDVTFRTDYWHFTGADNTGTDRDVPSPAALGFLGIGLAGLGLARRRRMA